MYLKRKQKRWQKSQKRNFICSVKERIVSKKKTFKRKKSFFYNITAKRYLYFTAKYECKKGISWGERNIKAKMKKKFPLLFDRCLTDIKAMKMMYEWCVMNGVLSPYQFAFHSCNDNIKNVLSSFKNILFWCDLPLLAVFIIFVLFLPSSGSSYPSSF